MTKYETDKLKSAVVRMDGSSYDSSACVGIFIFCEVTSALIKLSEGRKCVSRFFRIHFIFQF